MLDQGRLDTLLSLAADIAPGVLLIGQDDSGQFCIARPGSFGWTRIGDLIADCAAAPDAGRARLLQLWPDCPRDVQDRLLSAISIAPALFGGAG
jgi:hypothetical protein